MRRFAATACVSMSEPQTSTRPAVGGKKPATIRIVVVLPAPFGPRNPSTSPGCDPKAQIVDGAEAPVFFG